MAGIFGIGISGIQAAQLGMVVTQHNITNSNTPGYNRQSIVQATQIPVGTSIGFQGNGVQITTIQRQYNTFLTNQTRTSETQLSQLDMYFSQIKTVDDLLADANAGVSPALQDFFAGVQQVAAAPSSLPARQAMVSAAEALVSRFQSADARISDLYGQVNQQIQDNVGLINTYAQQIANLNQQITVAESSVNQPANDLLDQRDKLVSELNKLVAVQVIPLGRGGIEVLIGKGQLLVMGNQANAVTAVRSAADPSRLTVALDLGAGPQELPEEIITGGELGGLLRFRSETLDVAVNSLGKVAASLALTFNAQHQLGMDMLGNSLEDPGFAANFFTYSDPEWIPSAAGMPDLDISFNAPEMTDLSKTGNYFVNVTNSDYRLEMKGNLYQLTRLTDKFVWTDTTMAGLNVQIESEGFSLNQGNITIPAGQSYMIQPTREFTKNIGLNQSIVGDVRLVAAGSVIKAAVDTTSQGSMSVAVNRIVQGDFTVNAGAALPLAADFFDGKPDLSAYPITVTVSQPAGVLSFPVDVVVIDAQGYSTAYPAGDPGIPLDTSATYVINGGVMFSLKGSPKDGDSFTLSRNDQAPVGVSDSSNILLLGKLQTQNTADGANTTFQGVYARMVSDIGNKAREVEVTRDAQQSLVDQANAAREAESGVNLDEEAANLLRFQQLYQASARSISVGQKLFDELLGIARG